MKGNTMSVLQEAIKAEELIGELVEGSFALPQAILYSVKNNSGKLEIVKRHQSGDVYDLLEDEFSTEVARNSDLIALATTGWAAPIVKGQSVDDMTAPSKHPERRRVRLVVTANRISKASVMRFSDEPEEIHTDDDQAKGTLADAVQDLFARASAQAN
jgi:hypothetical protein